MLQYIATTDKPKFVPIMDNLVKLGFAIAEIYPPNISVLNMPDLTSFLDEFDEKSGIT